MKTLPRLVFAVCCATILQYLVGLPHTTAQESSKVDYARDIQPLLRANCYSCHGAAMQSGGFRLDRRRDSMPNRVGANGARIVPGNSAASGVYLRVAGSSAGLQMPPSGALSAREIDTIKTWIEQGADWPDASSGEMPSTPDDPAVTRIIDAIRRSDRMSVRQLLQTSPSAARSRGAGGSTALMYAALYGDVDGVRLLLDRGADPNARSDAGATALLWAVDDARISRLLLERDADPNAASADGRTPLLLAAGRHGSSDVVKVLLQHGAATKGQAVFGRAAAAGDEALMRLLLAHGAERSASERDVAEAMRSGCWRCIELLLESGGAIVNQALGVAARSGDVRAVRMTLDRGAEPTGEALVRAAASERVPVEAVTFLLQRGARDDAALEWAMRQGDDTPVVAALKAVGSRTSAGASPALKKPAGARSAREAVEKSLPLLQHADVVFLTKAGCVSCHNNSLFQMTTAAVRAHGFRIDERTAESQRIGIATYIESWRERVAQDIPIPGAVDTIGYTLAGLAAARHPPDAATDALARYLLRRQAADGGWRVATHRAPIESSDLEVTAMAMRAVQTYAPSSPPLKRAEAVRRATAWLSAAPAHNTEDHVFRVLGLVWVRAGRTVIQAAARQLIALQRTDGGWGQIPTLGSDAYATGQALTALAESGIPASQAAFQKGVRFLLDEQLDDGSWYVRSRTRPLQPYFDSEFPHGRDQFVSAAASNWATMALAPAAR